MPDLVARQMLRARNGLAYLTGANRPAVAQTPRDLVWKRDKARLWRYRSGQRRYRPPVLIVHSLVSKSYGSWPSANGRATRCRSPAPRSGRP